MSTLYEPPLVSKVLLWCRAILCPKAVSDVGRVCFYLFSKIAKYLFSLLKFTFIFRTSLFFSRQNTAKSVKKLETFSFSRSHKLLIVNILAKLPNLFVNATTTFQRVNKEIRFKLFFPSVEKMEKVSMPTIAILFSCPTKPTFQRVNEEIGSIYFLVLRLKKERNV